MSPRQKGFRLTPRLVLGLGLMLAGVILTMDQLELYDAAILFDYWPLLVIAVGATKLGGPQTSDRVFAAFWIGLGLWLLAWNLEYVDFNPVEIFWPAVLILFGLTLIFGALRRARPPISADSRINVVAIMGGVDRKNSSREFMGGDIAVFMGGGELDLRQAEVSEPEAVIQVFAMWGGYGFRVPPDWKVSLEVLPLLAGIEDHRTQHEHRDGAPTLTIKGVVIMGGLELKN